MARHSVPWDELPNAYKKHQIARPKAETAIVKPAEDRNFLKDTEKILKRFTFGLVCGSLTGACFGFVDVIKDPKAMTAKKIVATQKVLRHTYLFGGFFGCYQGIRHAFKLFVQEPHQHQENLIIRNKQQELETNIMISTILVTAPLVIVPSLRPMIPYGILLIGLDTVNEIKDNM
mmetsp:Transcript_34567/g.35242  ORF Transcript_34567/g.35242 Transcript_34567/m.35242 type:complete len:175 (+) Transcript_34567:161-685(+)